MPTIKTAVCSQIARGLRQTKATPNATGGRKEPGKSMDSATSRGSMSKLSASVNTSRRATHIIQARIILAVCDQMRSRNTR